MSALFLIVLLPGALPGTHRCAVFTGQMDECTQHTDSEEGSEGFDPASNNCAAQILFNHFFSVGPSSSSFLRFFTCHMQIVTPIVTEMFINSQQVIVISLPSPR